MVLEFHSLIVFDFFTEIRITKRSFWPSTANFGSNSRSPMVFGTSKISCKRWSAENAATTSWRLWPVPQVWFLTPTFHSGSLNSGLFRLFERRWTDKGAFGNRSENMVIFRRKAVRRTGRTTAGKYCLERGTLRRMARWSGQPEGHANVSYSVPFIRSEINGFEHQMVNL